MNYQTRDCVYNDFIKLLKIPLIWNNKRVVEDR